MPKLSWQPGSRAFRLKLHPSSTTELALSPPTIYLKVRHDSLVCLQALPRLLPLASCLLPSHLLLLLLPPTPSMSATTSPTLSSLPYRGNRSSNGSAYAASSILSRSSVRKNLKPLNVGLTQEEHAVLVAKILADLRPASYAPSTTAMARPASRPFSSAATIASAHQRLAANKMKIVKLRSNSTSAGSGSDAIDVADASSQSDQSHLDDTNANKLSTSASKPSTPQLSQTRTPTPTTPASPSAASSHIEDGYETGSSDLEPASPTSPSGAEEKNLLTPTAALESLRTLENSFARSSVHLPREESSATLTEESKPSSPTTSKSTMDDKDAPAAGAAPRNKRCSSYRKSVPTLAELGEGKNNALGISAKTCSSPRSDHRRLSSSTAKTDSDPSWIPSLTTLEAIRVLAFQQDVAEALASPTASAAAAKNGGAAEPELAAAPPSADEVLALRCALKFAIARADRLAEALSRATEDKMRTESELEILKRNVLSMLGSKSMFGGSAAESVCQSDRARRVTDDDLVEETEADHFDDARSRQSDVAIEQSKPRSKLPPQTVEPSPRTSSAAAPAVTRPARAARAAKSAIQQSTPYGSVSIASLRKNNVSTSAVSQRYEPAQAAFDAKSVSTTTTTTTSDDEDDEFSMYPFGGPTRRTLPEVSLTDFLNASRMSKIEIEQHDARRELERALEESSDRYSTHSRSPLASLAGGSIGRKGLLKSIGRIVDGQRRKDSRETTRDAGERRKSFLVTYQESIIPSYVPV